MKKIYRMEALSTIVPNFKQSENNPYEFNENEPYFRVDERGVESLTEELAQFAIDQMGYSLAIVEVRAA
jgi:hypothetical protein